MSSVNRPPSDPPGSRGSRRPGRTIDLSANEVASESTAPPVTEPLSSEPPAEPLPAAAAPEVSVEETPIAAEPSTGAPSAETPAASPREPDLSGSEPPPPSDTAPAGSVSPNARKPHRWPWRWIGIGAAAVVVAGIVFVMVGRSPQTERAPRLRSSRLAQVERQIAELTSRPVTASVDPKIVDDLRQRLARVEAAVASPRATGADPALGNRIGALEGELKALSEKIDMVTRRNDETATVAGDARARADAAAAAVAALPKAAPPVPAPPPGPPAVPRSEVEALANRVTALEQAAKALQAELVKRAAADAGDRAVRVAVSAAILQSTVERGNPFPKELASAKMLAGDTKALTPLEPFAASGVPSAAALSRELTALLPAMRQAAGTTSRDETFLQRLQSNAEKLVRVRPLDAAGDDASTVLARIDRRAAQSDVAGVLAELAKLPPAARAPAQAWIAKAEASNAAIEASRKFAADALAALGQPTP